MTYKKEGIRTHGDVPELNDLHDITIIVARMQDRDKYFYTNLGKVHTIHVGNGKYLVKTVDIVYNNNWLVENGVLRYEIWVKGVNGGTPWLWKHTNNGITVTHSMPDIIKLEYEEQGDRFNGNRS